MIENTEKRKSSFPKELVENANLHKITKENNDHMGTLDKIAIICSFLEKLP